MDMFQEMKYFSPFVAIYGGAEEGGLAIKNSMNRNSGH